MAKVITHRFVEAVRPKAARTEYPDAGCPGLYLVVQPSGTRSWAVRFRRDLGGLVEAYAEVAKRLGIMSEGERPHGTGPVLVKG